MKRKGIFLIIIVVGLLVYWKGFHKTYHEDQVYQQADQILILDKKNIQNKIIWKYVTNPSVWDISFGDRDDDSWNWKKTGLKIDDYICLFRTDYWYWKTTIEDEEDFQETLQHFQLKKEKIGDHFIRIYKEESKIAGIQYQNNILWSYDSNQQKDIAIATALFLDQHYFSENEIQPFLANIQEGGMWIKKNTFLEENAWVDMIMNETGIRLQADFQLKEDYRIPNQTVAYDTTSWMNFTYTFNGKEKQFIRDSWKKKIDKVAGFSIDSIWEAQPEKLQFTLQEVTSRTDTAVTYEFDDDFNEIEVIKENRIEEPSFSFSLQGKDLDTIWNYLKKENAIDSQNIFVNMPLVKTQARLSKELQLISENYKEVSLHDSVDAIAWLEVNVSKIDPAWYKKEEAKYKEWNQWISKIDKVTFHLQNKQQKVAADLQIKSKNDFLLTILD